MLLCPVNGTIRWYGIPLRVYLNHAGREQAEYA